MEKYSLYVDSTMSDDVDTLWTNRPMFNWLNVTASGFYMTNNTYTVPNFVSDYKIGISMAEVHLQQEKFKFSGNVTLGWLAVWMDGWIHGWMG